MSMHFNNWGWISFLSYVAESKVFDKSGYDSIESAKLAKAYNVLVWASEKHDKDEIINESLNKK